MVPLAIVRQYAAGQQIGVDVSDQEIVLHYVLELLSEAGLTGKMHREESGLLLFKGGTALRKCIFGQMGRFSQDIDMDAAHENGFERPLKRCFPSAGHSTASLFLLLTSAIQRMETSAAISHTGMATAMAPSSFRSVTGSIPS